MKEDLLDWAKGAYRDATYRRKQKEKQQLETLFPDVQKWVIETLMPALGKAIEDCRTSFCWVDVAPEEWRTGKMFVRVEKILIENYGFEVNHSGFISGWAE